MSINNNTENVDKLNEGNIITADNLAGLKNRDKIMYVLQSIGTKINSIDLAGLTNIHPKNVGRYIKALNDEGFLDREPVKKGTKRYVYFSITELGYSYEIKKPKAQAAPKKKSTPKTKTIKGHVKKVQLFPDTKADLIKQLSQMFLTLPVRKVDYTKFEFKSSAEFRAYFMDKLYDLGGR